MKYLKYYISTPTLILAIFFCSRGSYYPTAFFICFSLFIILGDFLIAKDDKERKYNNVFFLNLPIYINLPILIIYLMMVVFILGDSDSNIFSTFLLTSFNLDLLYARDAINTLDAIFLVALSGLFIGIMGTVPGHELSHRTKENFDLFMANWLLSLSWDCAFAIEHVYGHHKNVGLSTDPATAKRGENIYLFIIKAIVQEQKDAWTIEYERLRKKDLSLISLKNRMISGYSRSIVFTILSFFIGGPKGMLIFLLCAFIAKALLEVINYTEHYGLVRVEGERVSPRHSWNSNSIMSSIYLYNVTRHSSHHEKANLKYWELKAYDSAPMMPHGYLTMLYLAIFMPFYFHRIMAKKLIDWDKNYATKKEKELSKINNRDSGIPALINFSKSH